MIKKNWHFKKLAVLKLAYLVFEMSDDGNKRKIT